MYYLYILKYAGGALHFGIMTDLAYRSETCNYSKSGVKYVPFRRSMGFLRALFSGLWQVGIERSRGLDLLVQEKKPEIINRAKLVWSSKKEEYMLDSCRAKLVRCFF